MRALLLRLAALAASGDGFFLLLKDRKECVVVEQPLDTPLTVRYEMPALEAAGLTGSEPGEDPPLGVTLTLVDRHTNSVVFSKIVSSHKGEESMATVSEANHDLCVKPVTNKLEAEFRFELEVERGHGDQYYSEMASENHMDRLQVEVVKLNDELAEILNEADYMKEKEVKFHKKAERINLAAIWWPILQIAILVLTATFQVHNLKGFFQSKHLY